MSYLCSTVKHTPLILSIFTPVAIFISYGMAVGLGHVHPLFPYISDTGTKAPESCLFSIFLSSISFILCIIVYVRYRQVSEFIKFTPSPGITPMWNRLSAGIGYLSCLGLDLVACFQETNHWTIHMVGAMMCFFSATAFFLTQTIFTYRMYPKLKWLMYLRAVFTALNLAFILGIFIPAGAAFKEFKGKDVLLWKPEDGGYGLHLVSTFSEWFLVFSFCIYVGTFQWDFWRIDLLPPDVKFSKLEEGSVSDETESLPKESTGQSMWI